MSTDSSREAEAGKKPPRGAREPSKQVGPRRVERLGTLLAALVCGPFYGIYWWKAYDIFGTMYGNEHPAMWTIYAVLFVVMTAGVFHGIRPPSEQDEIHKRMPSRRVLMLVMTPFSMVYGMIYLASLYPPWPQ